MSLQLQIINIPEGAMLAETLHKIPASGGIIGRAADCTVPLPDNSRYLSSRHARIYQEDSQWLIEDLSTNGLLINNDTSPLGPSKHHTLTDGDILTCGDYRIMVNLFSPEISLTNTEPEQLEDPLTDTAAADDPFLMASPHYPQATAMVLDDPFSDTSAEQHNGLKQEHTPANPEAVSVHFGSNEILPPIDQLITSSGEREKAGKDPANLIDILNDSLEPIPVHDNYQSPIPPATSATSANRQETTQVQDSSEQPVNDLIQRIQTPVISHPPDNQLQELLKENRRLRDSLKRKNRLLKKMIYHAMGESLEQTLLEFSPAYLEKLFDDYSDRKRGLFRKRDNWQLYTRHYQRVVKEQTARLSFTARFQAALRKLQEKAS